MVVVCAPVPGYAGYIYQQKYSYSNVHYTGPQRGGLCQAINEIGGICALAAKVHAWNHFGFRFDQETGAASAYERAFEALALATREDAKRLNTRSWSEVLYTMLGKKWKGESYILGFKPSSAVEYDIGFNMKVGRLLPVKAWPNECWDSLESILGKTHSISTQKHLDDLEGYMNWINSCRMIVTNDSLGLFLAIAMNKKVLGLFGPTSATEHPPHENLRIITPPIRDCMPCYKSKCEVGEPCMAEITPQMAAEAIRNWGLD